MLGGWLSRWRSPQPASVRAPTPRSFDTRAASPPAPPAAGSWLVTRRPLIGRSGGIAGWDLQLSARAVERLARRDTPRVLREAYWFALAQAARETAETARNILLAPPCAAVGDAAFIQAMPTGTILRFGPLEIEELEVPVQWNAIEARGLKLALPCDLDAPLRSAYRLFDAAAQPEAARNWRQMGRDDPKWIAANLRSYEEVGSAVRDGVALCCGNFVLSARRPDGSKVAPAAINAANLLSAIISGRPPREIAEQFKTDTALSHRLLQATSSAAFALHRPLDSIQEAVLMLGTRELYRWLSVLLMSADSCSTLATALHETALTRGRLLELLAEQAGRGDPPEQLFVTGTFSLLDLILNVPLEVALALTPLPTAATEALIGETGRWWPYLDVALAIERDDLGRLESATATLGLNAAAASTLATKARAWAAATIGALAQEPNSEGP